MRLLLVFTLLPASVFGQAPPDPLALLDATMAAAEASLKQGEMQVAESHFRTALMQGWILAGALRVGDGQLAEARDAFQRATTSAVDADAAFRALALVHLQMGEPAPAVRILTRIVARHPKDVALRQLLTQALVASGQPEQAVQELEEARGAAPDDLELAFLLASGYLRLKKIDAAERLFVEIAKAKPQPQTDVLIGRAYRDAGEYERARTALRSALRKNPKVRRAHYYLGTTAVLEEGVVKLEEAIAEFQRELALAPTDPVTNLRLGMALVEAQRPREALPALRIATAVASPPPDAFHYLGRCQLALDQPVEAVAALRRALELSKGPRVDELRLLGIHYLLAQALRKAGDEKAAGEHFSAAEQLSARRAETYRDRLANYLADADEAASPDVPLPPPPEVAAIATLTTEQRRQMDRRVRHVLAGAALNLGVMHAQAERFARAAELFESAALADPAFPQVQYSLGVSYFNAKEYQKAAGPLSLARDAAPDDADVRRMLAVAWLNTGRFEDAAALLESDPRRESDPSLQYAYGLALVRSNQAERAEGVFARLMANHGSTPELSVVLGQAHAQQGDFESAVASLRQALQLKPDVAEANATLGLIYLRQGKLDEASAALRTELKHHPADAQAAHLLATVLDLQGGQDEAIVLLRSVLQRQPEHADARYLLGKILLARGVAAEAVEHLEIAARVSADEPNIHYQLAQAYLKLGRAKDAEQRFEIYRQIKDKRRTP